MPKEPLGITFVAPAGQDATGVYEVEGGVEVFETDTPYLLSDGVSLMPPLPIFDAGGPVFIDSMGNVQRALGVKEFVSPEEPENGVVHQGDHVVHEGVMVVHNG